MVNLGSYNTRGTSALGLYTPMVSHFSSRIWSRTRVREEFLGTYLMVTYHLFDNINAVGVNLGHRSSHWQPI
ncbi:hypothetical protein PILCRDRAFT_814592 [Piloderma croceum F 1598]|uniref:Uncharacterized protein n=1 Tax=Piloderma croceum (strain F 1598) TaxID=765440 RepID=A0A0C3CDU7_PILCF|nr:hypothetical protein PILCRDRAFT_814592 [Piloderma croceum F 1598]